MENKPNMTCRVCGKEYFCCADSKKIGSWRTMACSEEHYQEYMKRIENSRKPQPSVGINDTEKPRKVTKKSESCKKAASENIDEE